MIEDEYITEFKKLYKKRYGVKLSDTEASFRANNLLNLYRTVLGPGRQAGSVEISDAKHSKPYDAN